MEVQRWDWTNLMQTSCLATFAIFEPTGAAAESGGEQVNNINQIYMEKSTRPFLVFNQLDIFIIIIIIKIVNINFACDLPPDLHTLILSAIFQVLDNMMLKTPVRSHGWSTPSTCLRGGMSPGDEAAGKQYSATCSEVEGGRQLETVKDLVEEVLESVILAGQRGVGVEEIIEDLIKDVSGREALDVVGNVEEMEVFETPLLHYGEEEQYLEEAMVEELAKVGSQMDVQMCSDDLTEAKGADNSQDDLNNYSKDGENNYSQDELNNSILLSEKFELSMSEGFDSGGGTQASDLSDERYVKDLTEAEREVEDSVGSRALCKIGGSRYATRAFATPIFVASATPYFRISATQTAATPKILF